MSASRSSLDYRPDIDGLRAVAVLGVVAFHVAPDRLTGGFLGVDVFFVISGYLITRLLLADLQARQFSIARFYGRRIRRIFPALALVLGCSYAFGWRVLADDELRELGRQIAAAGAFVSNFLFLGQSGYFDDASDAKLLLHTWSLSIEEQFYVVWPVVLWVASRLRLRLGWVVIVLIAASFACSAILVGRSLPEAFYLPQSRAWELLVGAALAMGVAEGDVTAAASSRPRLADWASLSGGIGIIAAMFLVHRDQAFPGPLALVPTLATAAVIAAGPGACINRLLLSQPWMVWIGKISYPLYLWHWPILSYAKVVNGSTPLHLFRAGLVLAAFALAWMTWALLERPIRRAESLGRPTVALVGVMAAAVALGWATANDTGVVIGRVQRVRVAHEGEIGHDEFLRYNNEHFRRCNGDRAPFTGERWGDPMWCYLPQQPGGVDAVVVGDSHAQHLLPGLAAAMPQVRLMSYAQRAVPFVDEPAFGDFFRWLLVRQEVRTVFLAAYWSEKVAQFPDRRVFAAGLSRTVKALRDAGKQVVIVDDVPDFDFRPRSCKFDMAPLAGLRCSEPISRWRTRQQSYIDALDQAAAGDPGVQVADLARVFCDESACSMLVDGRLMFRDHNHLNIAGSVHVGGVLARYVAASAAPVR